MLSFFRRLKNGSSPGAFARHEGGIAATEFALILPTLLFVYFGFVTSFEILRANNQVSNASATVADLATRMVTIGDNERDELFATGTALLSQFNASSTIDIAITSIINPLEDDSEPDITHEVFWSEATNEDLALTTADLANFDLPIITEQESIVLVNVKGEFKPLIAVLGLPTAVEVDRSSVRRPRFVSKIFYDD